MMSPHIILALPQVLSTIQESITSDSQKLVYNLSDGENSARDVAKAVKAKGGSISHMTVTTYWKKWYLNGIVIPSIRSGRYEKIIDIE